MTDRPHFKKTPEKRVSDPGPKSTQHPGIEEGLEVGHKRLSQIVQGSPIPTFVIDHKHVFVHCNKAFENLTGISAGDIIGTKQQWLAFYPAKRPVLADLIVDGATEEEITGYYGRGYRNSKTIEGAYEAEAFFSNLWEKGKWLFFTAAPLKDDDARIIGAIETLQDITEQKHAEEALRQSEQRHRTLLDFLPSPVVLFTIEGNVSYLNVAFTETFGWALEEIRGKKISYVPPNLVEECEFNTRRLFRENIVLQHESKRLTKDGRTLDVSIRATVYSETEDGPTGELVILQDITREKRIARHNEAILRISRALPEYPDLEELLGYINLEVKRLLDSEGAVVVLRDEDGHDLYVLGAAYDATDTQTRVKQSRFPPDKLVAGKVIRSGEPLIINDISDEPDLHRERDKKLGYTTRNLLLVPLKSIERIIGVLCAINKKGGDFEEADRDLLSMIAGTVALSIENARFSEEIKRAYREVSGLNRAKDKVINHLSHELKTPVSILTTNLIILEKKLEELKEDTWRRAMDRAQRNLDRILEIQYKAHDIMQDKRYEARDLLSHLVDQCADELETLVAEQVGDGPVIERIRGRIEEIFGSEELIPEEICLSEFLKVRLEQLKPLFSHRQVEIGLRFECNSQIRIPPEILEKVIDGLIKNAVENTPDQGKIEILTRDEEQQTMFSVHDFGVGITEESQKRIFEGFFMTQATLDYSSKNPFDFSAGGKGTDLLRIKIFSERYGFHISMHSTRCRFIPEDTDICPGKISMCNDCDTIDDCHHSGETIFSIYFPNPMKQQAACDQQVKMPQ